MRRGEIRWYRFAAPDKRRPVLLLTRDSALEYLGEEPFDATTGAGDRRIEEDQARLLLGGAGHGAYDTPPVAGGFI